MLSNPEDVALLYGGAKGGAKTFLLCIWIKTWVEHLIKLFDLKPSKSPIALGFVGRKRSIDFHDTTLEEFKRIIPSDHYRLADDEHEIVFHDTAKVFCGGLDDPKRVEKFNSANLAFYAVDQAEETDRPDVSVLQASLRMKLNGIQPPYKQLLTANPSDCWLKEDFIDNPRPGYVYIPALYTDNPHLPNNYRTTLENAFRYNEGLLRAYRDGDWTTLQASNVLITGKMINDLRDTKIYPKDTRQVIACDPSLGGDECVIYSLRNGEILDQRILHERDTMKIAGHMVSMGAQHKTPNFAIDTTGGLGAAIADRIREIKPSAHIEYVNFAEKALDDVNYSNRRAEIWWWAESQILDRLIPYPQDEELRSQLTSVRFKVVNSNGRTQLEPKEETKKRLGRSPDRADAFVLGLWALSRTEPIRVLDAWRDESVRSEVGGGALSALTA